VSCQAAAAAATGARRARLQEATAWDDQQRRAALLPAAIGTRCPLCGKPLLASQAIDLHHPIRLVDDATSIGTQIVHASCNRASM
jgi:hypothetical protein